MLSNDLVLFKGNTHGEPYPIDLTLPLNRLFHIAHSIAATPESSIYDDGGEMIVTFVSACGAQRQSNKVDKCPMSS